MAKSNDKSASKKEVDDRSAERKRRFVDTPQDVKDFYEFSGPESGPEDEEDEEDEEEDEEE